MGFVIVDAPRNSNERPRYWRRIGGWGLVRNKWASVWTTIEDAEREVADQKIGYANIKFEPVD